MKHNILYSFRRCPYAIRARWALLNTNQVVELREVQLKNKPIELIQISKKATVPVLKTSLNKVIDESLEIMIWSIKRSNMHELFGDKNNDISKIEFEFNKHARAFAPQWMTGNHRPQELFPQLVKAALWEGVR